MQRDGDLLLNVSCSHNRVERNFKLPKRMPDGSRITSRKLIKKVVKTHQSASSSGKVFIPKHRLPVLDEFGLTTPNDDQPPNGAKKRKAAKEVRNKVQDEPKIIPREVQEVAGGLPPSFPKYRIRKFTEEYQAKKRRKLDGDDDGEENDRSASKRRSFVPGLNPRKRSKDSAVFTDMTLDDLEDVHPFLKSNLTENMNIEKLTRIQWLSMPDLLRTRFEEKRVDFLINSGIGTGKILTYVVPIVNNLALSEPKIDRTSGICALILLPTRELAAQISEIFTQLCRSFLWVVPGLLTGGERKKSEKARLRKGLNILITTPGRLIDHMEHSKKLDLSKMRYCVMADAHRLLDPERADVSRRIALLLNKRLPRACCRCVVTASTTKKLEKFWQIFLDQPKKIDAFKSAI